MGKLFEFLRKIFLKKETNNISKDEEKEEIVEEINISNINFDLIRGLANYDIVIVKGIGLANVKHNHIIRPFLIEEKNDKKLIARGYYFTSKVMSNSIFEREKYKGYKIIFDKNNYELNKNSLLLYTREITLPYENIINYVDYIHGVELARLKKYKDLLSGINVISSKENRVIEIADIVLDNDKKYLIYQMDNTNCYGYVITESNDIVDLEIDYNYLMFDRKLYYIDYSFNKIFSNNDRLCIIGRFNNDVIELIKEKKKKIKIEKRKIKKNK